MFLRTLLATSLTLAMSTSAVATQSESTEKKASTTKSSTQAANSKKTEQKATNKATASKPVAKPTTANKATTEKEKTKTNKATTNSTTASKATTAAPKPVAKLGWTLEQINDATWSENIGTGQLPIFAKAQVMLNNAYAPAGAIDAASGQKTDKALRAFQVIYGLQKTGVLDQATWDKLVELNQNQPTYVEYTITAEDVNKSQYVASIPADYGLKAKMKALAYTRVSEMLGEKFHMDETFLQRLNPHAKFVAGEKIIVANVTNTLPEDITLIVAHKTAKQLYLFNSKNQMVGSFPATFGNDPKALVGEHTIVGVARNPWYSYSPSNFVQGNNLKPLSLPPGPNGPVGNIWIGLSKKSFGIHGTPDPSKISTNHSHGCIRLSNWDANNLGNYVQKGVSVRFVD
ncbi:MAG: L,D-transpeptidase family protein [Acinetobacter sp.]|nr:L,D-transpeptidase family protein [Acinetobacter sp.]